MEHFENEQHYQSEMNYRAEAEHNAMMEANGQAEMEAQMHESESLHYPTTEICKQEPQPERQLSFGEKLVGITFNPSGDSEVQRAKELCSELANMVSDHHLSRESSGLNKVLFNHTIGEIINAQMCIVKFLTFKY